MAIGVLLAASPLAQTGTQTGAPIVRPTTPITSSVQGGFDAATSALRRNQWNEAVRDLTPLVNVDRPEQRAQARYALAIAFSQLGLDDKALQALEGSLRDDTPLGKAIGNLRANLLLQLADKYLAEQGTVTPNPWLGQYERLVDQPNHDRYERIRAASDAYTNSAAPSMVLRVSVMLPLQGQLADVGLSILHGLQLGVQEFDGRRGTRLELLVVDVSDAKQASAAAQKLLGQHIDVVVGPLLAPAVSEAAASFNAAKIPMLALSNDRSVVGKGVYALNYLPSEQARLVARAAISDGKQKLAVLAPSSPYGSEATEAFTDEAKRLGATVTGTSFFEPGATDIGASIRNLVGTKNIVPFEALFLPAPATNMALLRAQLNYYDIDKAGALLLGTGLWQNDSLLKPGTGMQGAVFAAPPKDFAFEQSYQTAFASKANALAVVGYDTARILADIAGEKQRTSQPVDTLLLRPEGFYGSGGYFRFAPSGMSQRGLDLVKVGGDNSGSQFEVQSPALRLAPLPLPTDLQPTGNAGSWNWR